MSYKWPNKDPQDTLDYTFDWARLLGSTTITNVVWQINSTVVSSSGQVVDSLTSVNTTSSPTSTTILLSGGAVNVTYNISCRITSSSGLVIERSARVSIKEQ